MCGRNTSALVASNAGITIIATYFLTNNRQFSLVLLRSSQLIKLLRYKTSKTGEDDWRSLEDYVGDMKEWQQHIYYIAGADIETVSKSAFCEKVRKTEPQPLF